MTTALRHSVDVRGPRQSGRTERMIWICAGAILAGGSPLIPAATVSDRDQTWRRLDQALRYLGIEAREAQRLARRTVQPPGARTYGETLRLLEVESPTVPADY